MVSPISPVAPGCYAGVRMRLTSMHAMGVLVPTLGAFVFETALMLWSGQGIHWDVIAGRTAAMAVGALLFSLVMFKLFQERHRAVMSERRRLEAMFQNSSEAILLVDRNRKVKAMNLAAEHLLGVQAPPPEFHLCRLCNVSPAHVHVPGQCGNRSCDFDLTRPNPFFESMIRRADGTLIPVAVSTSVLPPAEGREEQAMVSFRDISERRALERVRLSRLIAARTMEAQEEERRRIAQELHDGIGQELYGLRLCAQVGQPVEGQIVTLMEEVQRLATSLYPPVLEKLGLVAALRSHADRLWSGKVSVEVAEDVPRLSRAAEAAVFRMIQEAVGNALRHGKASHVVVTFQCKGEEVQVQVRDDGCGFVPEEVAAGGLGLVSMQERVESLGGRFSITSTPGKGTRVTAWLHSAAGRHADHFLKPPEPGPILVLQPVGGVTEGYQSLRVIQDARPDRG